MESLSTIREPKKRSLQRHGVYTQYIKQLMLLLVGYGMGNLFPVFSKRTLSPSPSASLRSHQVAQRGTVLQLDQILPRPTSHIDQATGLAITKQQLIEPFAAIDNLAGISVATLLPHQTIELHEHESMHEFFYVLQGRGSITVNGVSHSAKPGTFVHVAPHEKHSLTATNANESLIFLTIGVTTGPKTS